MSNHQQRTRLSVLRLTSVLDVHAAASQDDDTALLLRTAAKALTQLQSHSDRVTAEVMDWRAKCEQVGQFCEELEDEKDVLVEENERLLLKCQQLEACQQMNGLDDESECSELNLVRAGTLLEVSPEKDATTTKVHRRTFSGDVYNQLNEFELSLDMELGDFQKLGLLSSSENENDIGSLHKHESGQDSILSHEAKVGLTSCQTGVTTVQDNSVQSNSPERSKGSSMSTNRNPIHVLQKMFQTQEDDTLPPLTTSNSLFSLSSDCSISQSSMLDVSNFASTKRALKMSPQPNAEWDIIG